MNENQYRQLQEFDRKNVETNAGRTAIGCMLLMACIPLAVSAAILGIWIAAILSIR